MSRVQRRCVFYVSGFDPKGAAHYHAVYKQQAELAADVNGMATEVGPRRRVAGGNSYWEVRAQAPGGPVHTHYEFMQWDDVVRGHWPKTQLDLWWKIVTATLFFLRTGTQWKMFRLSWPFALAVSMPFLILCGLLAGLPLVGALVHSAVLAVSGSKPAAWSAAVLSALPLLWLARRLEGRYNLYWMMRSYAFTARQARGQLPDLEARLDALAARLVQKVQGEPWDEVLVVGHSSGAIMASAILGRALRLMPQLGAAPGPTLSLLTLGQCIPLLALMPPAEKFRSELALLGSTPHLDWIDFSAPPDGCCFALVDPLGTCGLPAVADRPKLLSPRFAAMFDAAGYQALRADKLQIHFQYLRASAKPVEYDYFLITAGEMTLADRFSGQPGVVDYDGLRPFRRLKVA